MKNDFLNIAMDAGKISQELERETDRLIQKDPKAAVSLKYQYSLAKSHANLANLLSLQQQSMVDRDSKSLPSRQAKRSSSEYLTQFVDAMKLGARPKPNALQNMERFGLLQNAMTELGGTPTGAEGGFLTPDVFDTLVELQRSYVDLGALSTQAPVNSLRGWRAAEEASPAVPLEAVTENTEMDPEIESPEFMEVPYQLKDYGGFLRVVASLFEDTPVAIMKYLARWWGRKVALRNNVLFKALVDANLSPVTPATTLVQAIKDALIKTLDPLISANSAIVVNPTGLALLDAIQDDAGHPLMSNDWILSKITTLTVSSSVWADGATTTPIFVGDVEQFATLFFAPYALVTDGGQGKESWRRRNIEVKGIYRCDLKATDVNAGVLIAAPK